MMASEAHRITIDSADGYPPALPPAPEAGLVLAYVPASEAEACGRHMLEFAHRWRDEGHRVVLADARVESPVLHEVAGIENGEGVTDVVLHGTSLARVAVELDDGVALVTAGTIAPDPERVLAHPRWTTLVAEFGRDAGLFVVAVSADADADRLEELAASVVRFGSAGEPTSVPVAPVDPGVAEPEMLNAVGASTRSHAAANDTSDRNAGSIAPTGRAEDGTVPRTPRDASAARHVSSPPIRTGTKPAARNRTGPLLVILLLVAVGVLGAAYVGWIEIPGITPVDVDAMIGSFPLR